MKKTLMTGMLAALFAFAQAPDNSKTNERDRQGVHPTADSQKMNKADTELVRKIRQSITKDKGLSTYAHNVKIVSQDGMITLRGPVRTEAEKQSIQEKATMIAGKDKVDNQLEIAPDTK